MSRLRARLRIRIRFAMLVLVAAIAGAWLALAGSPAKAGVMSSAFLRMPSRFMSEHLNLGSRGLGELCYGRDLMPDGSVCNPAFSDEVREGFLMGRVYVGNGYSAMSAANQLVFQPLSREFLVDMFRRNNVVSLEAEAGLVFASKYFQASFSPYRVQYFSEIHNPNLSVIALQASIERALEIQGGVDAAALMPSVSELPVLKDLSVGAKLRIVDRSYVSGRFSLSEALVEEPRSLLPVRKQFALYLDPSIGWRPSIGKWKFWTSVAAVNLGRVSHPDPLYESSADLAAGAGVEAPLPYGRLRLGLDLVNLVHHENETASIFRLGGSYKLGIVEGMAGVNENALTGGVLFGFQIVQAGIIYEFMRSELDGGVSENRISTEVSLRL